MKSSTISATLFLAYKNIYHRSQLPHEISQICFSWKKKKTKNFLWIIATVQEYTVHLFINQKKKKKVKQIVKAKAGYKTRVFDSLCLKHVTR